MMILNKNVNLRLKCLQLALENAKDYERTEDIGKHAILYYNFVTQTIPKDKKIKEKTDMNDMFKSWAYWKPIVIILYTMVGVSAFLHYSSIELMGVIAALFVLAAFAFCLHSVGQAFYEFYMNQIKKNYKGLTGKDYDAD
jgi:hypothetical protein